MIGGIRTCLGVSDDPMFLWISSNSCPLNLLLVRSHQAEIIIVKRLTQGRNSVTRVRFEPRSFDQDRRKNDAFTHSATLRPIRLPMVRSQTDKNVFLQIKGIVEKDLGHLFITSSSSHFFNKTNFERYLFKQPLAKFATGCKPFTASCR